MHHKSKRVFQLFQPIVSPAWTSPISRADLILLYISTTYIYTVKNYADIIGVCSMQFFQKIKRKRQYLTPFSLDFFPKLTHIFFLSLPKKWYFFVNALKSKTDTSQMTASRIICSVIIYAKQRETHYIFLIILFLIRKFF